MSIRQRLGLTAEPVYLIDGKLFIYRAFYANPDFKRSDGVPTNALYTIVRLLLRLLREERPRRAAFIVDGKGKTFRHALYAEYKANRPHMPEGLAVQLEPIRQAAELLGFPVLVSESGEADDYIASLADRFKPGLPVVIVGADKDLSQCLDGNVAIWDPGLKTEKILTLDSFRAETGLEPVQWPDYQALIGDSSDNIPGVPGIGPKSAMRIFGRFRNLEEIRDGVAELTPADRKKIEPNMDLAFLCRELTTLRKDFLPAAVPADFELAAPRLPELRHLIEVNEFRSLLPEVGRLARELGADMTTAPANSAARPQESGPPEASASGGSGPARPARTRKDVQLSLSWDEEPVTSTEAASAPATPVTPAIAEVGPGDCPATGQTAAPLRLETIPDLSGREVGLIPEAAGFRLAWDNCCGQLDSAAAPELIRACAGASRLYLPDLKALLASDPDWSTVPNAVCFDLGLAAYLLSPEERDYSLDGLLVRYAEDLPGGIGGAVGTPTSPVSPGPVLALGRLLEARLGHAEMSGLFRDLEMPLIPVLRDMEAAGVRIDAAAFAGFLAEVQADLDRLTATINAQAGEPFNLRSSKQMAEVLFGKLGLKARGKTPGGEQSTSVAVLEKLQGQHPIVDAILEYRKLEKLRSTYLDPLPRLADADGRIHTTFNQLATATGRLSSSNPNLQNIPIRGPQGKRMRACFTAAPGLTLVGADYSQIELRILAHFSGDATLIEAFTQGQDIHARTAGLLFDRDPSEVTPDERRKAKTINFGLLYGMGPQKLGRELAIPMTEAKAFIQTYFERLSGLRQFYEQVQSEAAELGYVTTICGRRRLLPDIHSRNNMLVEAAKRQAVNTRIQGSAADIIKLAMLAVRNHPELNRLDARLILQVHDELLLETSPVQAETIGKLLAETMSAVYMLKVPLVADWGYGQTWAEAH